MTSDRPYRKAMPPEEALAEIVRHSGTQFDPKAALAFIRVFQKEFAGTAHRDHYTRKVKAA